MEDYANLTLREHVEWSDPDGFKARLEKILAEGSISPDDLKTLKLVADPLSLPNSVNWSTLRTPLQDFLMRQPQLRSEARLALALLGFGSEPEVVSIIERAAQQCMESIVPGTYWRSLNDFLLLIALGEDSTIPHIRLLLERAPLWSISLACRFRLPESRNNGDFKIIDSFRKWMIEATIPADCVTEDWRQWQQFATCMTLEGFRHHYNHREKWLGAPTAYQTSPLIDWALDHNYTEWLVRELTQNQSREALRAIRERLVTAGVPAAVEFCYEQVRKATFEDYTHYDVIHNLLRLLPRPLPKIALDACVEVIRNPSHPAKFQHRIEALELLVDGANHGTYPKSEAAVLIVQLAQGEFDPEVRAAAIDLIPWINLKHPEEILASLTSHESSRIREAAERALSKCQVS